jgi:hypothetical protein
MPQMNNPVFSGYSPGLDFQSWESLKASVTASHPPLNLQTQLNPTPDNKEEGLSATAKWTIGIASVLAVVGIIALARRGKGAAAAKEAEKLVKPPLSASPKPAQTPPAPKPPAAANPSEPPKLPKSPASQPDTQKPPTQEAVRAQVRSRLIPITRDPSSFDPLTGKFKGPEYLLAAKNTLANLQRLGCKMPDELIFTSFNPEALVPIQRKLGITEKVSANANGVWQTVKNRSRHYVFINTDNIAAKAEATLRNARNMNAPHFIHGQNSLAVKEHTIAHELGHRNSKPICMYESVPYKSPNGYGELPPNLTKKVIEKIGQTAEHSGNSTGEYIKSMLDDVVPLTGHYEQLGEIPAEMFALLTRNPNLQFTDKTMLLYDILGGGAIPNRMVKGMRYEDYMKSLYARAAEILA